MNAFYGRISGTDECRTHDVVKETLINTFLPFFQNVGNLYILKNSETNDTLYSAYP
ncbi:MAG: hypothetical protein ACI4SF_13870 [Oscillospiraceae bacterium]